MKWLNVVSSSMPQSDVDRRMRIESERIQLVWQQSLVGLGLSVLITVILAFFLRTVIDLSILLPWLAVFLFTMCLRLVLHHYYPRNEIFSSKAFHWSLLNNLLHGFSGFFWATSVWLLFPKQSIEHQFILVMAICGLVLGAGMALAVMIRAYLLFSIPAMFSLVIRLWVLQSEFYLTIAALCLLCWSMSYLVALNHKQTRTKLLNLKEDLADRVAQRTIELENANTRLRSEVTMRSRIEERLREERDRLENITGNIGAGMAIISNDYSIVWANQVLRNMLGEVENRSCFDTIYKGIQKDACNAFKVLEGGKPKAIQEKTGSDAQGNTTWSQIITTPILDNEGNVTGALELVLPITELKTAQDERQHMAAQLFEARKFEAVATLAGGMAHKFNNALAVIIGNVELIRFDVNDTDTIQDYLSPIISAANQMSQMTDQLLAYAKGGKYKAKPTDGFDFVQETISLLKHKLPATIQMSTAFENDLGLIKIDITQMQMALSSIMANATEAIENDGHIEVSCSSQTLQAEQSEQLGGIAPGEYLLVSIRDNGVGMDDETVERIFEPFFSTKFEGRGLGMAAVYGIVRNHGGHVAISSQPRRGTQVDLYLPKTAKGETPPPMIVDRDIRASGTILLVEDEALVQQVNQAILERLGYQVISADTGQKAIGLLRNTQYHFDIVLLDIKLPDMDGAAIYPIVRQARPEAKVIVCSGYALDDLAKTLIEAGADGFIQKPFSIGGIQAKLGQAMVDSR